MPKLEGVRKREVLSLFDTLVAPGYRADLNTWQVLFSGKERIGKRTLCNMQAPDMLSAWGYSFINKIEIQVISPDVNLREAVFAGTAFDFQHTDRSLLFTHATEWYDTTTTSIATFSFDLANNRIVPPRCSFRIYVVTDDRALEALQKVDYFRAVITGKVAEDLG